MTHHVILGAGPAGVIAAETIRKLSPKDDITLIGDEPEAPYSRMAIPYLLMGEIGESGTHLRHAPDHYSQRNIKLQQGRAQRVDCKGNKVILQDGKTIGYDRLLIATGSSPASPPIPGFQGPGVHACWTLEDARAIMALAKPGARVVQMGAGFIGCIIMEALAERGVKLAVVEMGDRMVPRMMGEAAGQMIKAWCESKKVAVHTGARVDAIERDGQRVSKVRLSTGVVLDADLVISATGVKPNIGFLDKSGITCADGVLTDCRLETNIKGVYAAGDCAQAYDKFSGESLVSAIQPNAAEQARVAALNMIGHSTELACVTQINVLDTLGLISSSFGRWQGVANGDSVSLTENHAFRHLSLQFDGDVMVGCNSVGWTEHVGVMRGLVEGQVHLGDWKDKLLKDPTRLMEAYLACATAQSGWSGAQDARRR